MKINFINSLKLLSQAILGFLYLYRFFISPLLGANCRYLPSCSEYAKDSVITHGPFRGTFYALRRVLRCHPWADPKVDEVPKNEA